MTGLQIEHVFKNFDNKAALIDVSLELAAYEVLAVLGPSGCGKSTLLNIVAGLTPPDSGQVKWDGQSLQGVPPHRRGFGLMFQDYALFPHRNVFDNVAFGLRMAHTPAEQTTKRVNEVLALVGMAGLGRRDVVNLSGGEAQRVALARALAPRPRLLMLDEPLGSLDRNLRERLVSDLRQILTTGRQTAMYVTHDLAEAFTIADRVAVMNAGRVVQVGAPQTIYLQPANAFVARFLGLVNLLPAEIQPVNHAASAQAGQPAEWQADWQAVTNLGVFPLVGHASPGPATILLRPEADWLPDNSPPSAPGELRLSGVLESVTFRGSTRLIHLRSAGADLQFEISSSEHSFPSPGSAITIRLPAGGVQTLPGQ